MARIQTVIETTSAALMAVAAITLIYTVMNQSRPQPAQAVSGLKLSLKQLRNVIGTGQSIVVAFSDFECPACAAYERQTQPQVESSLLTSGRVRYAMVNYPLEKIHPLARKAAEAGECAADQGKYWEMHRRMFSISPDLSVDRLVTEARKVGLDGRLFAECLRTGQGVQRVAADVALGKQFGIAGTPTFFIGSVKGDVIDLKSRIPGSPSFNDLSSELRRLSGRSWLFSLF